MMVPPKSSILIGFSIINHPFWGTPIFWKHPGGKFQQLPGSPANRILTDRSHFFDHRPRFFRGSPTVLKPTAVPARSPGKHRFMVLHLFSGSTPFHGTSPFFW